MNTSSRAVAKVEAAVASKPEVKSIHELIQASINQLRVALPSHMNAERIARIALTTIRLNPKLMECTPQSFLGALFQSAQLGLEPNVNGESWIIPYRNSKKIADNWVKVMEAQFQVGAYGWVKLFYNHQNSVTLQMEAVHQKDEFSYDLGTSTVHHVPLPFGQDRGPVVGYYAVATMTNGGKVVKTMSKAEAFEHGKRHSKCWDKDAGDFMKGTPWKEHFDAMAQVTVLKQVMKLVPKSVEIQKALAMDQTTKTKLDADMLNVPDETNWTDVEVVEEPQLPRASQASDLTPPKVEMTSNEEAEKPSNKTAEYNANEKVLRAMVKTAKDDKALRKIVGVVSDHLASNRITNDQAQVITDLIDERGQELQK